MDQQQSEQTYRISRLAFETLDSHIRTTLIAENMELTTGSETEFPTSVNLYDANNVYSGTITATPNNQLVAYYAICDRVHIFPIEDIRKAVIFAVYGGLPD